jgi:hypothetical protein
VRPFSVRQLHSFGTCLFRFIEIFKSRIRHVFIFLIFRLSAMPQCFHNSDSLPSYLLSCCSRVIFGCIHYCSTVCHGQSDESCLPAFYTVSMPVLTP